MTHQMQKDWQPVSDPALSPAGDASAALQIADLLIYVERGTCAG